MYVAVVPNRGSRPAILLRESYRDGDEIKNRTLKNLSDWPAERIQLLRAVLRGETLVPAGEGLAIVRALPHGHVSAALGTARRIGLDRLLPRRPERRRKLALALIVARLIDPAAKLATARALDATTAIHSLGATLGLGVVTAKEVYAALDWLGRAQPAIEKALARRHLEDGCLVLYDLTSSYLEGRCCALARFGYSRDGRRDKPQIVIRLLCAADGCPIAVEVFEGDTADPSTLAGQIAKIKDRFGLKRVVLVGDRGLITSARIEEELQPAGLDWITALRGPAIRTLAADGGPLQLSLFDERDLAEIESPDYPGERLVVCARPRVGRQIKLDPWRQQELDPLTDEGGRMEELMQPFSRGDLPRREVTQTPDEVAGMLRLKGLGWGIKRIAKELGCSHMTVRHYVAQGGWLPYRGGRRRRALGGLEDWLAECFRRHAGNADVVRQELAAEKGIKLSLRTVEREVAPLRRELEAEARATCTAPRL